MDYAEPWLMAQTALKQVHEFALKKDWEAALIQSDILRSLAERLGDWFEDAHLTSRGK